jgi:hypothetical protein
MVMSFIISAFQPLLGCSNQEIEMNGACTMRERDEKCVQNFNPVPNGKIPFRILRHRGRIILKWTLK